ncbi:MAG: hypothetical protein WBY53_03435 [Acidobacteriaceae bacterium]
MKWNLMTTFPVAAALVLMPALSSAATPVENTPGVVQLTHALDARKATPGEMIETRLTHTVHLADGTKLPGGSWLTAKVVRDAVQPDNVRLALRFTSARLKDGTTIPIKATIIDVAPNPYSGSGRSSIMIPDNLKNMRDSIDAIGVESGVDMHSRVSSNVSGVFVSTKKDDVKLPDGTQMELALSRRSEMAQK